MFVTSEVEVVILDPPAAPVTSRGRPDSLSTTMAGLMEDIGLLPVTITTFLNNLL